MGFLSRTTSGGTNMSFSNVLASNANSGFMGFFGQANTTSQQYTLGQGFFSVTSSSLPGSVAFSQIAGTNATANMAPIVIFANSTV